MQLGLLLENYGSGGCVANADWNPRAKAKGQAALQTESTRLGRSMR